MKAVVVTESWFGNAAAVGAAVAQGMRLGGAEVTCYEVNQAPMSLDPDVTLIVVGAPTHNRSLSTVQTRAKAAEEAGRPTGIGAADWIAAVELPAGVRLAVFDTTTGDGWLSGSAAKTAARLLERRARGASIDRHSFLVAGMRGPLRDGELDSAHAWGRELATEPSTQA